MNMLPYYYKLKFLLSEAEILHFFFTYILNIQVAKQTNNSNTNKQTKKHHFFKCYTNDLQKFLILIFALLSCKAVIRPHCEHFGKTQPG